MVLAEGRKYTHQLLMYETKLTHINEQVSEAMYGVTRKEPEPGETNWAIELKKEQERLKLLIPQKVQEVTVTESNVTEEEVEDISEVLWAFTRVDLEVTDVRRKSEDEANIDSNKESEYSSDNEYEYDEEN